MLPFETLWHTFGSGALGFDGLVVDFISSTKKEARLALETIGKCSVGMKNDGNDCNLRSIGWRLAVKSKARFRAKSKHGAFPVKIEQNLRTMVLNAVVKRMMV
jgi:hypothetical protein